MAERIMRPEQAVPWRPRKPKSPEAVAQPTPLRSVPLSSKAAAVQLLTTIISVPPQPKDPETVDALPTVSPMSPGPKAKSPETVGIMPTELSLSPGSTPPSGTTAG